MKCPFCAEEIKDEALLCRFCGARLVKGQWQIPAGQGQQNAAPRSFTMLTTGWLLALSGAWMLISCTGPVPLFGAVRSGAVAVLYNGALGLMLLAMGYALAARKPWALAATLAATAGYTIDKLLFIFDASARQAYYEHSELRELLNMLSGSEGGNILGTVDKTLVSASWCILAGWWGLVIYIYLKRSYFREASSCTSQDG